MRCCVCVREGAGNWWGIEIEVWAEQIDERSVRASCVKEREKIKGEENVRWRIRIRREKEVRCGGLSNILWRTILGAPQKVAFLWRTSHGAPQNVPRWNLAQ